MKGEIAGTRMLPRDAVANNLTTTEAGKVLDARQGKILHDEIQQSTAKTVDSGVLATYTYGALRYRLLTNFGVAQIIWAGNANIPDETTVNVSLPDKLKPAINSYAVMRNGDMMEVRNETASGILRLTFGSTPKAWSGASITYIP